jgi:lipopolysaccharide export system ATP-binding protein
MKVQSPDQIPLGYDNTATPAAVAAVPVIKLAAYNLRKKYKSRAVVADVSFEVAAGEVVGLLGPNGAGKTTCFYMIVGLVAVDSGEIRLENGGEQVRLTHMPIHQRAKLGLSYLPQENSVFRKLTVSENVRAVLELQDLEKNAIDEREEILLQELHITHIRKNLAASLSGGERRRVEIARAGDPSALHPARRTLRRRRSDCRARHPEDHPLPHGKRHRRPHHRPQRA